MPERARRPKHRFLAFILCALILPSVAVVLVAVLAMISQEKAMEAAVSSYVQDLAESTAYHLNSDLRFWTLPSDLLADVARYRIFSWGPSIPGWVAHVGLDGRALPDKNDSSVLKRTLVAPDQAQNETEAAAAGQLQGGKGNVKASSKPIHPQHRREIENYFKR